MKDALVNLFGFLTMVGIACAIIFGIGMFRNKKGSKQRKKMKHIMWYSIIALLVFGETTNVVGGPQPDTDSSSNSSAKSTKHESKAAPKPVHHSNNWKIQHEMPKTVSNDNMDMKSYVEGEFSTPKYTMNLFINDPDYTNAKDGTTRVISILNDMKKYDYKGFSDVGIVLQTKLQDHYGRNLGYRPVDVYSFKASDISKMQPLQMDGNDLDSIATKHDIKPVSGN